MALEGVGAQPLSAEPLGATDRSMATSKTVIAAWVGFAGVILAAVVGGLFFFFGPNGETTTVTMGPQSEGLLIVTGEAGDLTINYNVPETETKKAIAAFENKLEQTGEDIRLNRGEIAFLTRALRDLDQRTSGIDKLPDGRTKIGGLVTGQPRIVLQKHNAAVSLYRQKRFADALLHSQAAIEAYEKSKTVAATMRTGNLSAENSAKIYFLGALLAQQVGDHIAAHEWAQRAAMLDSTPSHSAMLATALANLNRHSEALTALHEAIQSFPGNQYLIELRGQMAASQAAE